MWQRQWGNSSIFNDTRIYIAPTIPPVTWFKDLDPENVIGNLEFSYYVKHNFSGGIVPAIPTTDVVDYFTASSTPKSFLNPVSLKVFFDCYDENNYKPIISRFNMINNNEIDAIIGYFNQIVKDQIQYSALGGSYEQSAFAKLIVKALNNSFVDVQKNTLYELTSRYTAAALQVNN